MEAPIPITVLGGYLGAGKTTLLNRVLAAADGRRVGVVVNDFGELGVDAALISSGDADGIIDLPNGCVCCTLGTELGESLDLLAARRPRLDHLVIEASGVADPTTLAAWGTVPGFSPGGVVVLAAADTIRGQAADRYVGGEVRRQLDVADLVVVTKCDLVDAARLDEVEVWLRGRSTAPVVRHDEAVAGLVLGPQRPSSPAATGSPSSPVGHTVEYRSWTWRPTGGVDRIAESAVRAFVDALPTAVLRAKGFVNDGVDRLLVQVVGRHRSVTAHPATDTDTDTDLTSAGPTVPSGLVVIAVDDALDPVALDALAARHLG